MTSTNWTERLVRLAALPYFVIAFGLTLSFIAWLLPPFSSAGKGFVGAKTTGIELSYTFGVYATAIVASAIGYHLGSPLGRKFAGNLQSDQISMRNDRNWTIYILIAVLGVGASLYKIISSMGIRGGLRTLASFNANAFKEILYDDYSAGVLSLRYVAILAAAVAVFRLLAFRECSIRSLASFACLGSVALISSRLSIVWSIGCGTMAYLIAGDRKGMRSITRIEAIAGIVIFIAALGALTVSRTYGYYQEHGAESFAEAIASEFQRYLAAPFHGSILSANYPEYGMTLNQHGGIDTGLTTNSALMELATSVGRWNSLALVLILTVSGFACGLIRQYSDTYLALLYGILQACHLEIWRLLMFQRGITLALIACIVVTFLCVRQISLPVIRPPMIRIRL
jgi:hypothetical protein